MEARKLQKSFEYLKDIHDASTMTPMHWLKEYDVLVLGTSTLGRR